MKSASLAVGILLVIGLLASGCATKRATVGLDERGTTVTLEDINFSFDKTELLPEASKTIDPVVDFLVKNQKRAILIEGFTDSIGSDRYNLKLSQQRADAVRDAITAKGIAADRIFARGYGKQFPVAGNDLPAGRQKNRRVEIVILNEGVSAEQAMRKP